MQHCLEIAQNQVKDKNLLLTSISFFFFSLSAFALAFASAGGETSVPSFTSGQIFFWGGGPSVKSTSTSVRRNSKVGETEI